MFIGTLPNVRHVELAGGDRGIFQTCSIMRAEVNRTKSKEPILSLTSNLIKGTHSKTEASQKITQWVAENITYREDVDMSWTEEGLKWMNPSTECPSQFNTCESVEMLYQPEQMLQQRFGDCDDFCMLLGAMHETAGIPVRFVVAALNQSFPGEFSHVYLKVKLEDGWVSVDGINKAAPWGWEAPHAFRRKVC